MKVMFLEGRVTPDHVNAVARLLARFHSGAERSRDIDAFGTPEKFKINTDENFAQTEKYAGITLPKADYVALRRWTDDFYAGNKGLFQKRIAKGKIRDCHGDLHMEHICLTDPVAAIDCIEFNDRFRYSDTLSDIAFLLMDLEYHGGGKLASHLWEVYVSESGDEGAEDLLTFYKVYRAYVRGKVISFRLDDDRVEKGDKGRAAREAEAYFALALRYIQTRGDEGAEKLRSQEKGN
jgi:uncharacterized protein